MIKSNELRIGNWIIGMSGKPFQVTKIIPPDIDKNQCKGIPLTRALLADLGFKSSIDLEDGTQMPELSIFLVKLKRCHLGSDGREYCLTLYTKLETDLSGPNVTVYYSDFPILYLHQLQNLFFALTGGELTITK
jgi:hypothetical protein